ncbi:MAG: hypothetical protein K0B14_15870 [Anaerolineaceae bacterium]|nr:hypothetical protein [Anaerolineaceae bacterium]
MDKAVEQQVGGSSQTESKTQPIVRWAQDVSEWAKNFFTLTEEEKDAAGISDYKNYNS